MIVQGGNSSNSIFFRVIKEKTLSCQTLYSSTPSVPVHVEIRAGRADLSHSICSKHILAEIKKGKAVFNAHVQWKSFVRWPQ